MAWTPAFPSGTSKYSTERTSIRKSIAVKSDRFNLNLNKSYTASQICDESHGDALDIRSVSHGLPVIVSDALSISKDFCGSARFSYHNDFIWLVVGRKLFVWKYSTPGKTSTCRELTLPVSDLEHKSALVCLTGGRSAEGGGPQLTGCVAVSPEGMVRYWPKIYQEDVYLEATSVLRGEECVQLEEVRDGVYLLATTTCTLLKIDLLNANTMGIVCTMLGKPSGLWSGIGRRVSSFFTLSAGQTAYNLKCVRLYHDNDHMLQLFALTEEELQCKVLRKSTLGETAHHEVHVVRMVRDLISRSIWRQDSYTMPNLRIQPLDMEVIDNGEIYFLFAVTNTDEVLQVNVTVHYAIVRYRFETEEFDSTVVLQWTNSVRPGEPGPAYRLTLPLEGYLYPRLIACVWDSHTARVVEMTSGSSVSSMTFSSHGDGVLACCPAATERGQFLIFSRKHRILSIRTKRTADFSGTSFLASNNSAVASPSPMKTPLSSVPMRGSPPMSVKPEDLEDEKMALMKAFLAFNNGYADHAIKMVRMLTSEFNKSGASGDADTWRPDEALLSLSAAILDEAPGTDPRWRRSEGDLPALVASGSVIIQTHLEEKRRVHQRLTAFISAAGLSANLGGVPREEKQLSTTGLLQTNAERLELAVALRGLQASCGDLLDLLTARVVLKRLGNDQTDELTPADLFYREVTRIGDIFEAVLEHLTAQQDTQDRAVLEECSKLAHILATTLREITALRRSTAAAEKSSAPALPGVFRPNLVSLAQPVLTAILERLLTVAGHTRSDAGPSRLSLASSLVDVIDYALSGFSSQLDHAREHCPAETFTAALKADFERTRTLLINGIFQKLGDAESALLLAERYREFDILVRICEHSGATDRLQRYMRRFENQGFTEFVFRWYLREGKRGQLMAAQLGHQQKLAQFLEAEESQCMAWLEYVNTSDFEKAAENLKDLAVNESDYLAKKKTLLSLAKLSCLAAGDSEALHREDDVAQLDTQLEVVEMQESFPEDLLLNLGLDRDSQPAFPPEEIIELFIGKHNPDPGVTDFRKALDLVQHVSEERQAELRSHVWCQALLIDDWSPSKLQEGDPISCFRDTLFYRILESAYMEGIRVPEYLPSLDGLLNTAELAGLVENKRFVFLLKAGYEQMAQICG